MSSRRLTALVVFTLAVAGCSSSPEPTTPEKVAGQIGCTGVKRNKPQIYAQAAATCSKGGRTVYVYTFETTENRDHWLEVAKTAGAPGEFASGDLWVTQTM